jgi:hypothetical protein
MSPSKQLPERRELARRIGSVSRWRMRDGPEIDPRDYPADITIDHPRDTPCPDVSADDIVPGLVILLPAEGQDPDSARPLVVSEVHDETVQITHLALPWLTRGDTVPTRILVASINSGTVGVIAWP